MASVTPADIRYAFFGLPTYGEVSGDVSALDAIPEEILGHGRYACDNDTVCGWAGSLGGIDGINVVSGTGSITYGERAGNGVRVGGWGELFGDEGSAYWIAIKGLNAFSRMSDGRLPVGPLHETLRTHLALEADLDLVDVVLNRWQGGRSEIAALSRVVAGAAEAGDECAARILSEAADEARRPRGYHQAATGLRPGRRCSCVLLRRCVQCAPRRRRLRGCPRASTRRIRAERALVFAGCRGGYLRGKTRGRTAGCRDHRPIRVGALRVKYLGKGEPKR